MITLRHFVPLALIAGSLVACVSPTTPEPMPLPGSDRDAHGCIGSAGYSWCTRTAQCERPWELASQQGFELSADGYAAWCDAPR